MELKIKLQLYKELNFKQPYENSIKKSLISEYSELIYILNLIENKTKFFYLDNKAINKILYDEEEIIQIENKKYEYSFIYYLSLLLKDNKDIVNFNFGIDFIKEIDNENNNQENELKKLFVSKILLDLIFNYDGIEENEELEKMKEKNKMYIIGNKNIFKKYSLNLEENEEISLEKLYINIIIELIKSKKLENYDFANDIFIKLDLENIDINQNMFEELKNILDDEKYINDYKMNNLEDFFVEKNINFYYILIKYIFKNSFFIYNIPLLYNIRNTIIKIIKTKRKEFLSHYNKGNFGLFKRLNYNIKFILDSNYYHNIFLDLIFDNKLEEVIKNENSNSKDYIKILNILEKNNDKIPLINYIYESRIKDMEKIQFEFQEIANSYKQLEKMIKDKKIKIMRKEDKLILSKYFIDNKNKDSLLKIFGQDSYDFFLKESIKLNIEKKEEKKEEKQEEKHEEKQEKENKLMQILKYYKTFFFESKKDDINAIENIINKKGDLDYKICELDLQKAQILNERIPLINYVYKIKDENNAELEIQQIIEKYNSLEKLISERKLMKDLNIENETITNLYAYFNDKNNKDFLIKIFGKENYEFTFKYFNENIKDNKIDKKNRIRKADKFSQINTKENFSGIKNQNNIENEDSNLLSISTKFQSFDSRNMSNNSEPKKMCDEEKLASRILKKSEVILSTKKEGEKLVFLFESVNYGDHHIFINYEKLLEIKENLTKIENIIAKSFIKYMEFLKEFKKRISKEFLLGYKLKIGLETQIIGKAENESIFNINCFYKLYSPNSDNNTFKEENILLNKTNSEIHGFTDLINEINDKKFEGIKFQENPEKKTNKISDNNNKDSDYKGNPNNKDNSNISNYSDTTKSQNLGNSTSKNESSFDLSKEAEKYQILKIIGIMGEHKNTAEFIIELSNGYYISGGNDLILKIYDQYFNKLLEIKNKEEWVYSCFEIEQSLEQNKNDYDIELIACCYKKLNKISLSFKDKMDIKYKFQNYEFTNLISKNCIIMKKNFAFIGYNSCYMNSFLNSKVSLVSQSSIISGRSYFGSIKINKNIIAITSNKVLYNGEDKLIFYDVAKKVISGEIEGYSFISGINGLALMPREETKVNNKILLCACKKYFDDQKNGIYLANPQLDDKQGINKPFYDTGSFEVFCFCPILEINPDNDLEEKGKEKKKLDTDYFFVGGYNNDKSVGEIKLFKVIFSEKASDNKIEFVQDIEFERNKDFSGFEGAVSCITQTKKGNNGFILVTCYSGKVYLLTKPNLDYYQETKCKYILKNK